MGLYTHYFKSTTPFCIYLNKVGTKKGMAEINMKNFVFILFCYCQCMYKLFILYTVNCMDR